MDNKISVIKGFLIIVMISFISYGNAEELKKEVPLPPETLPKEVMEKLRAEELHSGKEHTTSQEEKKTSLPNKITLNVKDMEIIDVFNILAKKGGLNIVTSKNVVGRVTIFLQDIEIEKAFEIICEVNNLSYEKQADLIKVLTEREYEELYGKKAYDRKILKTIELKHIQPKSILQILNGVKSREGKIFTDERVDKLMIIDLPELIQQMEEMIKALDTPSLTKTFTLIYADPKKLEPVLKPLLSEEGKIQIDSLNKKMLITDTPENIDIISNLIAEFDKYPEVTTEIFILNYAKPEEIVEKIRDELTQEIGGVKIDKRTNKVIVRDLPSRIEKIREIITACDTQPKEVLIEAKIIQVALSNEFKFGIDWEYLSKQADNLNIKTKFGVLTQEDSGIRLEAGVLNTDNYHILLEALKIIGDTKLLSTPKLAVLSGQEAKILVGSNVPYITEETIVPQNGNPIKTQKVTYIDVGIKLYVTPAISEDGFVTIKITPEVSAVTRYVNNNIPVVETSKVESQIKIKEGNTIVIAGLVKEEKVKEVSQVPFMGNIPYLGSLFKKTTSKKINSELVILLTTRIITGEGETLMSTEKGYR